MSRQVTTYSYTLFFLIPSFFLSSIYLTDFSIKSKIAEYACTIHSDQADHSLPQYRKMALPVGRTFLAHPL